jgi:hypothetical protein
MRRAHVLTLRTVSGLRHMPEQNATMDQSLRVHAVDSPELRVLSYARRLPTYMLPRCREECVQAVDHMLPWCAAPPPWPSAKVMHTSQHHNIALGTRTRTLVRACRCTRHPGPSKFRKSAIDHARSESMASAQVAFYIERVAMPRGSHALVCCSSAVAARCLAC